MLVVHAGNRVDAEGGRTPARFPPEQVPVVRARLGRLLKHMRPLVVVSAAAAGSDLLVLEEALGLGIAVHVVLPAPRDDFRERSVADRGPVWLSAFVAMPFGSKPRGAGKVDCDQIFGRLIVPALEDADLSWQRADEEVDTGLIHVGMIEQLGNAAVVVVDTVTQNPNVFYELGVRHAFADKTTVLLGPVGDSPPFDVRPIRHFAYRLKGSSIDEASALSAVEMLRPVLDLDRLRDARRDSPVFEFFDLERRRLQARGAGEANASRVLELHQ